MAHKRVEKRVRESLRIYTVKDKERKNDGERKSEKEREKEQEREQEGER